MSRAIVISPRKAGTHLVQNLMVALGYMIHGEPVPPREGRPAFSVRERLDLARRCLHPDIPFPEEPASELVRVTDLLFLEVARVWQMRLAAVEPSNVDMCWPEAGARLRLHPNVWTMPFSQTPPGLCWVFHSIDLWRTDIGFLQEWGDTAEPHVVLNIRDPRDALVSMVNFFAGTSGLGFSRQPEAAIFRPILESIGDPADRITYALSDPAIPLLRDYEAAYSLFHHPRICTVSFEELVGPEGGGSRAAQREAVGRIAEHVGADVDLVSASDSLFDRRSFTFHRGRIGAWREVFTDRHRALFDARFGHLLEAFGYE